MTAYGYEYTILHRKPCSCVSGGYVSDKYYADEACFTCYETLGLNVPIVTHDGRLIEHLSCAIEREVRS